MDGSDEINYLINVENRRISNNDDKEFCSFYYEAIKRLLNFDNIQNASYLHRYLRILNEYYTCWCEVKKSNREDRDTTIIKLLEDSLYFRVTFVYRNAALLSSAAAFHLRNAFKKTPDVIKRLMKKQQVKICSFGGSSAPDIVGIVKVLESVALENGDKLDFRVTIIDSDGRWKNTCITVLSSLQQFHKATWKIRVIQDYLLEQNVWNQETLKAIQEADIITMVRFLFKLNHLNKMMHFQMIYDNLQLQAMFFILDHPDRKLIKLAFDMIDLKEFHLIHLVLHDCHTLDLEAVKLMNTLYRKHFGNHKYFRRNSSFNVFSIVWTKSSPETDTKTKENIEAIFQSNIQKCKPMHTFLSSNTFTKFEKLSRKSKKAMGWNCKGIKNFMKKEKVKRNRVLGEFISQRKTMSSVQQNSMNKLLLLEDDQIESNETTQESFQDYLNQKRQYSLVKKKAYFSSVHYYK